MNRRQLLKTGFLAALGVVAAPAVSLIPAPIKARGKAVYAAILDEGWGPWIRMHSHAQMWIRYRISNPVIKTVDGVEEQHYDMQIILPPAAKNIDVSIIVDKDGESFV